MNANQEHPHRKHRPYQRSKAKAKAAAAIVSANDGAPEEDAPFDPQIAGDDVGGGDPGLATLLTLRADEFDLLRA